MRDENKKPEGNLWGDDFGTSPGTGSFEAEGFDSPTGVYTQGVFSGEDDFCIPPGAEETGVSPGADTPPDIETLDSGSATDSNSFGVDNTSSPGADNLLWGEDSVGSSPDADIQSTPPVGGSDDDLDFGSSGEEILEMDDMDFSGGTYLIQDGVYVDESKGEVLIDDEVFESLADAGGYYSYDTGQVDKEGKKVIKKMKVKKFKRKKREKFKIGLLSNENFGPLLPFIEDINVTDINWNGKQLWIDDVNKGRYLSDVELTREFVDVFSVRISNVVSQTFNKYTPSLEAETSELRITIMHESVSHTGRAISIRKTPAVKRIEFMNQIRNGRYCTEQVANLLSNFIKAKFNVIVCGLPGVGKTELVKYLTNYIFPRDRVITVEDTLELHYSDINPGKDCLEFKVGKTFTYTDAIKESLRLLPQWVLLSEARSTEVQYLIESVSTGTKCITTLHADDVRKIPDRVVQMVGNESKSEIIENSVYNFFDVGILVDKFQDTLDGHIWRRISQVCLFTRENRVNKCTLLVQNGELTNEPIPEEALYRLHMAGIDSPYDYTYLRG